MRTAEELIDDDANDPGGEEVRRLLATAKNPIEVLRGTRARGLRALARTQARSSTILGAFAFRLGGVIVDYGWLRLLAGGAPRLERDLASWNELSVAGGTPLPRVPGTGGGPLPRLPGALLIADDAIGGFYALNEGGLDAPVGRVLYLGPDDDASPDEGWEDLELDYGGFFAWAIDGDLDAFYGEARFDGWEPAALGLSTNEVMRAGDASKGDPPSRERIEDTFRARMARLAAGRSPP